MVQPDNWSPDEPLGEETFEQGDEAHDEDERIDPSFGEGVELDPSIDPTLQVDERELEEADAVFDDPEQMVVLDGGIDDPDGLDGTRDRGARREGEDGWDLDAPVLGDEPDEGLDV